MNQQKIGTYYSLLHRSADEKIELGLNVFPITDHMLVRHEINGQKINRTPNDTEDERLDHEHISIEHALWGRWNTDGSLYEGSYPTLIDETGISGVLHKTPYLSPDEIHYQIDLAQKHKILIGIAAQTGLSAELPNAVVYADPRILEIIHTRFPISIESDGVKAWTFAYINYGSHDINGYFGWTEEEVFGIEGIKAMPLGTIVRNGIAPCYPSIIQGVPIRAQNPGSNPELFYIQSAADAGIYFERLPNLTEDYSCLGEDLMWTHTPSEDDQLFHRSVTDYEAASKPSKVIKRLKPVGFSPQPESDSPIDSDINLFDYLTHELATALGLVMENLPYDALCVLISFLTGVASMLRLGTTVTGNELTNYCVPVNLYTILRGGSGRKKSPLLDLFLIKPALDVMRMVAMHNTRMMDAWREDCRGKNSGDKPPRPIPLNLRINEYTGEAFVQQLGKLDEAGRAVLVLREEIAALFSGLNQYRSGKGGDEQQLLELYDGKPFTSIRVSDTDRSYSRAAVSIFGTIQPQVLDELLKNGDASGLWARFWFADLPDMTKPLPTKCDPEKLKAFEAAQQCLRDTISAVFELPAMNYKLDSEAMELFSDYEHQKQKDALSTKISAQAALYGKSAGKVLRIAGILHVLQIVFNKLISKDYIGLSTLQHAIDLVDRQERWTLACHARLVGITEGSLNSFERRLHEISLKSSSPVSWTDIRNQMSSAEKQGKTVLQAEAAMSKVVALGVGKISSGPKGGLRYKALKLIST